MKQRQLFDKHPQLFTKSALARSVQLPPVPEPTIWQKKITSEEFVIHSNHNKPQPPNDLYSSIKPIIILGRVALIIPCSRDDSGSYKRPSFNLKVLPYLATIYFLCFTFFLMIFDVQLMLNMRGTDMLGVMNYISNMHFLADSIVTAITYSHFLRNSDALYRIFEKWAELSFQTKFPKDPWLSPLAYFLAIGITTMSLGSRGFIMSEVLLSFTRISEARRLSAPVMETVYKFRMPGLTDIVPYHFIFGIALTICQLLGFLTITYISLLLIFFSRAISYQFRRLIEDATGVDMREAHFANLEGQDREFWQDIVTKYRSICLMLKTINNFLSPLNFIWITWNIYVVSMQLYRAMVGHDGLSIPKHIYTIDFLIQTGRFLLSVISAAKVNAYAKKILLVLRNCPKEYYRDAEVYRLEHQVATGQSIAFTGMGCFGLTKPFLLTIFSAIFTMEIILLQSTQF